MGPGSHHRRSTSGDLDASQLPVPDGVRCLSAAQGLARTPEEAPVSAKWLTAVSTTRSHSGPRKSALRKIGVGFTPLESGVLSRILGPSDDAIRPESVGGSPCVRRDFEDVSSRVDPGLFGRCGASSSPWRRCRCRSASASDPVWRGWRGWHGWRAPRACRSLWETGRPAVRAAPV